MPAQGMSTGHSKWSCMGRRERLSQGDRLVRVTAADVSQTGVPGGVALLDWLHGAAGAADTRAAPVLARLFTAAWRPFGEHLERWLFAGAPLPPSAPFAGPGPAHLAAWLPPDGDAPLGSAWVRTDAASHRRPGSTHVDPLSAGSAVWKRGCGACTGALPAGEVGCAAGWQGGNVPTC